MSLAIETLLADPDIIEIMISGYEQVLAEKRGTLLDIPTPYRSNEHLLADIHTLFEIARYTPQDQEFLIDLHLKDGTRVNIVLPPVAANGPTLTLRKVPQHQPTVEDLIHYGSWTAEIVTFLRACIQARLNIMIVGGTGSGKTTVMNRLCEMISPEDRVVVCEELIELRFDLPRLTRLTGRAADVNGRGGVSLYDLIRNAMKMRPDRILTNEPRDKAAYPLFQAMNTGHDGTLFAMHATSPRDALARLEMMLAEASPSTPLVGLREMVASGLNLIVQQDRLSDGSRRITKIAEVVGMQGDAIMLQDIFEFRQLGQKDGDVQGYHTPTGVIPRFLTRLQQAQAPLLPDFFTPR